MVEVLNFFTLNYFFSYLPFWHTFSHLFSQRSDISFFNSGKFWLIIFSSFWIHNLYIHIYHYFIPCWYILGEFFNLSAQLITDFPVFYILLFNPFIEVSISVMIHLFHPNISNKIDQGFWTVCLQSHLGSWGQPQALQGELHKQVLCSGTNLPGDSHIRQHSEVLD